MIDRIETGQIQELLRNSSSNQLGSAKGSQPQKMAAGSPKTTPNNSADVYLQVDYASLINKATQIPQADAEAVQRAQQLLESGQLESQDRIREAAENIIESGI
ncbi:MAG: hypothetical protein ACE5NM_02415 [Sedimentisphaerales bacterium]